MPGDMAYVYRQVARQHADGSAHMQDSTNGGWSSKFNVVVVTNAGGVFEPSKEMPGVRLVKHRTMNHVFAVSERDIAAGKWTMFGGNYLSSSDSRFKEAVRKLLGDPDAFVGAIPIHDRYEG